jgi:hypothetical protein
MSITGSLLMTFYPFLRATQQFIIARLGSVDK